VPKAEQPETIAAIAARLPDHASVIPLVESARGVLAAAHLAAAPRVDRLALGEADLAADLGVEPSPQALEFLAVRTQIVLVSAAAGIRPPLGPVATDFTDLAAFESSTRAVHRLGFGSRSAIHPAQVAVINRVFTRRLVEAAAAFGRAGAGVFVGDDGTMVDEAIVRRARRIVELADAYGVSPEEA
jgi:citrate lyase subunit beta/citryl-CoA lyase